MSTSSSPLAFSDCFDLFAEGLKDSVGARCKFESEQAALHFRMRMHRARTLDRQENSKTYPRDHHMYNRSVYDRLVCRIRKIDGDYFVYVEQLGLDMGEIESLSELGDEAGKVGYTPIPQLTHSPEPVVDEIEAETSDETELPIHTGSGAPALRRI